MWTGSWIGVGVDDVVNHTSTAYMCNTSINLNQQSTEFMPRSRLICTCVSVIGIKKAYEELIMELSLGGEGGGGGLC